MANNINGWTKHIPWIITVLVLGAGIVASWSVTRSELQAAQEDIEKLEKVKEKVYEIELKAAAESSDLQALKDDVKEIKEDVKKLLNR